MRRQTTMQKKLDDTEDKGNEELFGEKFTKVTFRDFHNNTRFDIKNVDLKNQQNKRDRMLNYWHNNVAENYLPQIDKQKRTEM